MGEDRQVPTHRQIDQALPRGIVQVVVATDDMRYAHVVVVGDHGQVVGRGAVRPQKHQVVEILGVEADFALDGVVDDQGLVQRPLEANDVGLGQVLGGRRTVAPGRTQGVPGGAGRFARGFGLFGRHEAGIGPALGQQLGDDGLVPRFVGVLEDNLAISLKA